MSKMSSVGVKSYYETIMELQNGGLTYKQLPDFDCIELKIHVSLPLFGFVSIRVMFLFIYLTVCDVC